MGEEGESIDGAKKGQKGNEETRLRCYVRLAAHTMMVA